MGYLTLLALWYCYQHRPVIGRALISDVGGPSSSHRAAQELLKGKKSLKFYMRSTLTNKCKYLWADETSPIKVFCQTAASTVSAFQRVFSSLYVNSAVQLVVSEVKVWNNEWGSRWLSSWCDSSWLHHRVCGMSVTTVKQRCVCVCVCGERNLVV